ncbi:MAG: bifunctional phosphoglucose/phosphomannose isomerase [Candidatus Omnitrophica bacterium]|nr:bifunctional phosphoglucose/phosphomannose isomerase [Candidatus Omnitrophota bacterium]
MVTTLKIKDIEKIDKNRMLDLLMGFPDHCRAAKKLGYAARILFKNGNFKNVLFCGIGGSAIGNNLVKSYLYFDSPVPMSLSSEPNIPAWVNKDSLVFITSYSGDTIEILSAYKEAKAKSANIIVISSGGKLKELSKQDNVTSIEIPKGLLPRCALGYLSIIPLCILSRLGLIKDRAAYIDEMILVLETLRQKHLGPDIEAKDNPAKGIAAQLLDKLIVIYAPSLHFDAVASRLRCQLNENSKTLAYSHLFPDVNHNEIVGWCNPKKIFKNLAVVIFKDAYLNPYIDKGMCLAENILKEEGIETIAINSKGSDLLSRIYSLIYTGDFVSFYLAIAYGVDPVPTERISYLKNRLSEDI